MNKIEDQMETKMIHMMIVFEKGKEGKINRMAKKMQEDEDEDGNDDMRKIKGK